MARIRTVKPAFFRHRGLFLAEREEAMPLRVAFAALWCCADREGRFRWEPEELKLDCLPWDEVDFSRVLHALTTRGFIQHYRVQDREYGVIPSFTRHQVINNKEARSEIPAIELGELISDACLTRASRVPHACPEPLSLSQGEGKGREGKGKEGERIEPAAPPEKALAILKDEPKGLRVSGSPEARRILDFLDAQLSRRYPELPIVEPEKRPVDHVTCAEKLKKLYPDMRRLLFAIEWGLDDQKYFATKLTSVIKVLGFARELMTSSASDWRKMESIYVPE